MATIKIDDYDGGPLVIMPVDDDSIAEKENILKQYWRPAMAVLYLLLCFLDYAVRPVVNELGAKDFNLAETVAIVRDLNPALQIEALEIASTHEKWPPILSEFVHMAFGAILTGAAITRGMEKTARVKKSSSVGRRSSRPVITKPRPSRPSVKPNKINEGPIEEGPIEEGPIENEDF